MAEETIVFQGFHQGSVMKDGALGPIASYIALKNTRTGRVLNVKIEEAELSQVVKFAHGNEGEVQEGTGTGEGETAHPNLDLNTEQELPQAPQEEPTPDSAFPEDGPEEGQQ